MIVYSHHSSLLRWDLLDFMTLTNGGLFRIALRVCNLQIIAKKRSKQFEHDFNKILWQVWTINFFLEFRNLQVCLVLWV